MMPMNKLQNLKNKDNKGLVCSSFFDKEGVSPIDFWLANQEGNTRSTYKNAIRLLFECLGIESEEDAFEIKKEHVLYFKRWLQDSGRKDRTVNTYLAACASLYIYLSNEQHVERNPFGDVKYIAVNKDHVETVGLTQDEAKSLLEAPLDMMVVKKRKLFEEGYDRNSASTAFLDHTFLKFMLNTGLRVSEVLGLKVGDLFFDRGERVVRTRLKGNRDHTIALNSSLLYTLNEYFDFFGHAEDEENYIFFSEKKGFEFPMHRSTFLKKIYRYSKFKGFEKICCHSTRVSFQSIAYENGSTVDKIANTLGYLTLDMSRRYIKVVDRYKYSATKHVDI